jgi:TetR/AcrR family transcriptional repressor of nem operon
MARTRDFDPEAAIEGAVEVFRRGGYDGTSMQDLVDGLGLSRSSLYDTFGDKQALYLAALDRYRTRMARQLAQALETGSARAAIEGVFRSILDEIQADTDRCGCFVANATAERAGTDPQTACRAAEALDGMESALRAAVERGQAAGEIDATRDAAALARFLATTIYGLRVRAKADPSRQGLEQVVQTALSVLG